MSFIDSLSPASRHELELLIDARIEQALRHRRPERRQEATIPTMPCPTCTRLDRDEALLRDAAQEHAETLRFALPEDVREAVLEEEGLLATLLAQIEERRAASVPN